LTGLVRLAEELLLLAVDGAGVHHNGTKNTKTDLLERIIPIRLMSFVTLW
jgi:hypothetical protein